MVDNTLLAKYLENNNEATGREQNIVSMCSAKITMLQDSIKFFLLSGSDMKSSTANRLAAYIIHELDNKFIYTNLEDAARFVKDKQTELLALYSMLASIYDSKDAMDILEVIINGKI